jgi:hypothetical protein
MMEPTFQIKDGEVRPTIPSHDSESDSNAKPAISNLDGEPQSDSQSNDRKKETSTQKNEDEIGSIFPIAGKSQSIDK